MYITGFLTLYYLCILSPDIVRGVEIGKEDTNPNHLAWLIWVPGLKPKGSILSPNKTMALD